MFIITREEPEDVEDDEASEPKGTIEADDEGEYEKPDLGKKVTDDSETSNGKWT